MARVLWPTLIAIALIVAVVVSAAGEETRTELAYLDEIRNQTSALARSGSSIVDVMARIGEVDREEFTTVFDSVRSDLDVAQEFVGSEPPTESLIPVWALYRQAVDAWRDGVNDLAVSMLLAADDPENATVVNRTGDALASLRAGDNLYRDLQAEFERDEAPQPVSPLTDVQLSPSDEGLLTLSSSYVTAVRRSTSELGLRPGLRVSQVLAEPDWDVSVENQAVVPATETIVFSAVITNSGNVGSEPESVTLVLRGGAEDVIHQEEVPPLQPDGQVTIVFPQVEVIADNLYEVEVELELANPDTDLSDNRHQVQFTINAG